MLDFTWGTLDSGDQNLLLEAEAMLAKSYSPYSNFAVGASLLLEDGSMLGGANIENISYGLTLCAERSAIAVAASKGKLEIIVKIAIISRHNKTCSQDEALSSSNFLEEKNTKILTPCGACRQVIAELARLSSRDIEILMSSSDKKQIKLAKISELLPVEF